MLKRVHGSLIKTGDKQYVSVILYNFTVEFSCSGKLVMFLRKGVCVIDVIYSPKVPN